MSKELTLEKKVRILKWKEIPTLFKDTFKEYFKESTLMHSASLAYYALFAMLPLIYLTTYFFGRIVGNEVVRSSIGAILQDQVGISDISGIMEFLKTLDVEQRNVFMEIVGIGVLLFSCSAFILSLKKSINDFYDITVPDFNRKKKILDNLLFRLVSILIIAFFGVLIIVFYIGETVLMSMGASLFENETLKAFYNYFLQHVSSILTSFIIFSFIFKYVNDGFVKWKLAMAGALLTAVFLYLGQLIIKYYLSNFFFATKSGGIGSTFFVLLTWIYYSAQIIFFGAKFTFVYGRISDSPITLKYKTQEELEKTIL